MSWHDITFPFVVAVVCSVGGFLWLMFALFACLIDGPLEDEQ